MAFNPQFQSLPCLPERAYRVGKENNTGTGACVGGERSLLWTNLRQGFMSEDVFIGGARETSESAR